MDVNTFAERAVRMRLDLKPRQYELINLTTYPGSHLSRCSGCRRTRECKPCEVSVRVMPDDFVRWRSCRLCSDCRTYVNDAVAAAE